MAWMARVAWMAWLAWVAWDEPLERKKYRLFCMPTHVDLKERDLNAFMKDSDKKLVRNQM